MELLFKIVICDDSVDFAEGMHRKISDLLLENNIAHNIIELYDGAELWDYCRKNIVDIILVDIDMPNMTGFEAIKELQKQQPELPIIFVTAHEEYAFQAYDYQPFWFVSKRKLEKLDEVVLKLIEKLKIRKQAHKVFYLQADKLIGINVDEIIYLKSNSHYISAYTSKGEALKFRCKIQDAYNQLIDAGYIYVQRCYIVNCRYIDKFNARDILLKNGEKISISRDKEIIKEAQDLYKYFLRRSRW